MIKRFIDSRIAAAAPTARQIAASANLAATRKAALSWKHSCPMDSDDDAQCAKAVAAYEAAKAECALAYAP